MDFAFPYYQICSEIFGVFGRLHRRTLNVIQATLSYLRWCLSLNEHAERKEVSLHIKKLSKSAKIC